MADINQEEAELLKYVPPNGQTVGNISLMRRLDGWDEQQYWEVRNRLIDRGVLEVGRGKGGSVRRPIIVEIPPAPAPPQAVSSNSTAAESPVSAEIDVELDLYQPMAKVLEEKWTKDLRVESAIVHITAQQGRKRTGGKWTRPDVTVATLATYPYVPGRHFDVISFEIKNHDAIDVTAVYEALAHLRSATRAYVLFHVPDTLAGQYDDQLGEICSEAKKHGIGVIVAAKPDDYATWEELVEAVRREPDPRRLNDFLTQQFNQDQREKLIKWFK